MRPSKIYFQCSNTRLKNIVAQLSPGTWFLLMKFGSGLSRQGLHCLRWTHPASGMSRCYGAGARPPRFPTFRLFSSTATPRSAFKRNFGYGVAIGLVGSVVLYNTHEGTYQNFRHAYFTVARIGVVTVATVRCFRLYRHTLGTEYDLPELRHEALSETHQRAANITLKALEKNGGIYIKLGQHISALTYLLPVEWTKTMTPLQDKCPRSSMEEIEAMFKRDLGSSIEDMFSEFNLTPVGVASLAQVHIATLKSGQKCAVKIQHPSLQEFVPIDIYMTQTVFGLMHKVFPEYPMTWLGDELQSSIYVELDFANEAENAERTAQYFQGFQDVTALRIPKIILAHKRILTMEYVAGARLDDLEYLRMHKIKPAEVSSCLSHIFNNMIFTPGVGLHCDPHGGNLAIRSVERTHGNTFNFEIILYDHGLYRQIPLEMKRDYSHFWLAILENNEEDVRHYCRKVTGIYDDRKFKIFMSAITGRDAETALNYDIKKPRTKDEVLKIHSQFENDASILEDLMEMLLQMPRIILMILKTNDLTRNLDESLESPLGPERTFLIMANYCAKVVYDEGKENVLAHYSRWSFGRLVASISNWWHYQKRVSSLYLYDFVMSLHGLRWTN